MYLSSGRGRKSGGARATGATPSLAPLYIYNYIQNSMTPPSNQLLKVCGSIIQISGMYILGVYSLVKWSKKPNKSWL